MRRDVPLLIKALGIAGFGILYIPVMIMIIYSFNSSKLVAVWAGFSTKWYKEYYINPSNIKKFSYEQISKYEELLKERL